MSHKSNLNFCSHIKNIKQKDTINFKNMFYFIPNSQTVVISTCNQQEKWLKRVTFFHTKSSKSDLLHLKCISSWMLIFHRSAWSVFRLCKNNSWKSKFLWRKDHWLQELEWHSSEEIQGSETLYDTIMMEKSFTFVNTHRISSAKVNPTVNYGLQVMI